MHQRKKVQFGYRDHLNGKGDASNDTGNRINLNDLLKGRSVGKEGDKLGKPSGEPIRESLAQPLEEEPLATKNDPLVRTRFGPSQRRSITIRLLLRMQREEAALKAAEAAKAKEKG